MASEPDSQGSRWRLPRFGFSAALLSLVGAGAGLALLPSLFSQPEPFKPTPRPFRRPS